MGIIETLQAEIQSLKERVTALEQIEKKCMYDEAYNDYLNGDFDEIIENAVKEARKEARQSTRDDKIFRITPEQRKAARARLQAKRQKTRDDIIEMANRDVVDLIYGYKQYHFNFDEQFVVNREKRTVVALLKDPTFKGVFARGIAKCHPDDCFNVHIGRAIALRRALGLEVPNEYLNAPQPTEVRVGDIIEYKGKRYTVSKAPLKNGQCGVNSIAVHNGKIIDDSRADAGQEV
jgi:hypothetical protein